MSYPKIDSFQVVCCRQEAIVEMKLNKNIALAPSVNVKNQSCAVEFRWYWNADNETKRPYMFLRSSTRFNVGFGFGIYNNSEEKGYSATPVMGFYTNSFSLSSMRPFIGVVLSTSWL